MYKLPPLSAVRVFEAASRHENFSRAATELAMTQAAVSYQMKLLEERLGGGPLFVRRGRGMILTELGRRIAPRVTQAFGEMDKAFAVARAENDSILSVTVPQTFAANWLAGRLGEFQIRQPDLAVRLHSSDQMVNLSSSEFDVAIRAIPGPATGQIAHFLMRMPVSPFASPSFLERYPLRTPADLLTVPRLSQDDDWWTLWFESLADIDASSRLRSGIRFESQVLDGTAAMAGHGVAILSPAMFQPAIDAGLLVQPFPQVAIHRTGFWLVYPEHKRNLPKVRAFRDWLLDAVKRAVGDDPYGLLKPIDQT